MAQRFPAYLPAELRLRYLGSRQDNSSITGSTVIIDPGTGNKTYGGKDGQPAPAFGGTNLGTFDLSSFRTALVLNGGTISTTESAPDRITSGSLTYRIRTTGSTTIIASGTIPLSNGPVSGTTSVERLFSTSTAGVNILDGLSAGDYYLSVQFSAEGFNADADDVYTIIDPSTFLRASFKLTGVAPTEPEFSTTWTGSKDDNWFDADNWTKGVPTPTMDATIPDFPAGSTVKYPNIYSDAVKPDGTVTTRTQNPNGSFVDVVTPVPGYNNRNSGPAKTRNLIMQGTSQSARAITRLLVGRLEVYGNFSNNQDSFIQRDNTVISFTGTDQTISGSTSGFVNMEVDGGGIKSLVNNLVIQSGGRMVFINGILKTDLSKVDVSYVRLATQTIVNNTPVASGRLEGENNENYLRGFVIIDNPAPVGTTQSFGNIGLSLTFTGKDPGTVIVTRNTGENVADINNGTNSNPSVRRQFGVRPGVSSGLSATMVFKYLDNETMNLEPGNKTLDEGKLSLFLSQSAGDTFGQLGRDALDVTTNTLTKYDVTTFATFTLSEGTVTILPVSLISFLAKRLDANAEITWQTATEQDNRGYDVQVSTDGRTFRTLQFVPSQSPNSPTMQHYSYIDTEANKAGTRYYRLRQVDMNGTVHFYGPRAVSFNGTATVASTLEAYPNPFQDAFRLTLKASAAGNSQLVLMDLTGRVVRQQSATLNMGSNDVSLQNMASLQSGTYLLRLALPNGTTQSIKVQKQ